MREAELRAELAGVPDVVVRVPTFERRHQRRRRRSPRSRGYLFDDGLVTHVSTLDDLAPAPHRAGRRRLVHLERLVASWRPLADLSFADLLLLAPIAGEEGHRFVVLAQVRPVTGQTNYPQDLVGTVVDEVERPLLTRSLARRARSSRATRTRSARRNGCACSASPCAATAGSIGAASRARRR